MDSIHAQSQNFRTPERWNSVPVPERVALRAYTNVEVREDGCWISRYSTASHGYAQVGWQNSRDRRVVLAHRAAWTHVHGQVPLGMTIDHLCKTRTCVNPDHLRLLPNFENARRTSGKDWPIGYCVNGHPSSELAVVGSKVRRSGRVQGIRMCLSCKSLYAGRANWRTRNPGEPLPDHLLLASERAENGDTSA